MTEIKRLTTPTLLVKVNGIENDLIEAIDFIARTRNDDRSMLLFKKSYPDDVVYEETEEYGGIYEIHLSQADTGKLPRHGEGFWLDCIVTLESGEKPSLGGAKHVDVINTLEGEDEDVETD